MNRLRRPGVSGGQSNGFVRGPSCQSSPTRPGRPRLADDLFWTLTLPTGRGRPSGVKKTDEFHIKPLARRGRHESDLRPFCVVARGLRGRPRRGRKRPVFVLLRRVPVGFGPIRPHPNARLCSRAYLRVRPDNTICRFAGIFTRATGLEPATSGVTGRSWRLRAKAGIGGDLRREQGLSTLALRGFAGMGGRFRRPPAGNVRDASLP
jgi:hypothetical protein